MMVVSVVLHKLLGDNAWKSPMVELEYEYKKEDQEYSRASLKEEGDAEAKKKEYV